MKWILIATLILLPNLLQAADGDDPATKPLTADGLDEQPDQTKGAIVTPKVTFTQPKDGKEVKSKFKAKFKIEGMKIKPAGKVEIGTGHHHIIVDGAAIPKGQVVPKDEKNLHYGKGETSADLTLTPGTHTLTLQFADGNHLSYGPELSQTITIKVK
jgi:hypothetical protein